MLVLEFSSATSTTSACSYSGISNLPGDYIPWVNLNKAWTVSLSAFASERMKLAIIFRGIWVPMNNLALRLLLQRIHEADHEHLPRSFLLLIQLE